MNIFDFSDYRKYILAWLRSARRTKSCNLTRLASIAKIHPTFLSHVLHGDKSLSPEQAALISHHLEHTRLEMDYFLALLELDRAGNQQLREYWQERKKRIETEKNKLSERFSGHIELTDAQKVVFYSNWIYIAIWVTTAIDEGQTLGQIAERFRVSRSRAEEILFFLTQVGLCAESGGRFVMGKSHVHVGNESPLVTRHHMNWRMKAAQKMDAREELDLFFSAPMSISKKDLENIREKLNVAIQEITEIAKNSPAKELVCLNIDYFRFD